ncbi:hypothetical protein HK104_005323 [Borealophlyctis nickersoniae]|nr:hypothetical protein HK104_005323 [Borealophlyctis nickersoniae]
MLPQQAQQQPPPPQQKYFELPAGLMVPAVSLSRPPYTPIAVADIRVPPHDPANSHVLAAVEEYYKGLEIITARIAKKAGTSGFEEASDEDEMIGTQKWRPRGKSMGSTEIGEGMEAEDQGALAEASVLSDGVTDQGRAASTKAMIVSEATGTAVMIGNGGEVDHPRPAEVGVEAGRRDARAVPADRVLRADPGAGVMGETGLDRGRAAGNIRGTEVDGVGVSVAVAVAVPGAMDAIEVEAPVDGQDENDLGAERVGAALTV